MNSINSISIKALRSPIDNSSDSLIRFMRGDSLNFRVAIFSDEDTLESLDDILSLRFEIYDIGNYQSPSPRTFSRLILKSIGAEDLNSSLTLDDWDDGESQHATFNLSAEESSIEYGEKWLKISAEVETDKFVTVSAGWIEVEENASAYPDTIITDVEAWTSEAQEYAEIAQSAAQETLELKEDLNEISTKLESALEDISTTAEQASIATESATSAIESATAAAESATQAAASVEAVMEAIETVDGTNIVTISGAQTISGKKVFSSPVSIGTTNTISGTNTLVVGNNCTNNPSSGGNSIIAGTQNTNSGIQGIVCGYQVQNSGNDSLVTGSSTVNTANDSMVGGNTNNNSAKNSLVIGDSNTNTGQQSFISGSNNTVSANNSGAMGNNNEVSSVNSFVSGSNNTVAANNSAILGQQNSISGEILSCFAAGLGNTIDYTGDDAGGACGSVAFGSGNTINDAVSFACGEGNSLSSLFAFAAGSNNTVSGYCDTAFGSYNNVSGGHSVAFGKYNQDTDENGTPYKFTFGDGGEYDFENEEYIRSNALSLDSSSNFKVKGDIENGTGDKLSEKADTSDLSSYATTTALSTLDSSVVKTSGTQTIAGTKTFSTIPRLSTTNVTPTLSYQVASKSYVDGEISNLDSSKADTDFSNTNLFLSLPSGTDLNDVYDSGKYNLYTTSSSQNVPMEESSKSWYIENFKRSSTEVYQRATCLDLFNTTVPVVFVRRYLDGSWTGWRIEGGRALIESYNSGYSFYKIYIESPYSSSSTDFQYWCEQGGNFSATGSAEIEVEVTLHYPFNTTTYYANCMRFSSGETAVGIGYYSVYAATTTSFKVVCVDANWGSGWYTHGYCDAP